MNRFATTALTAIVLLQAGCYNTAPHAGRGDPDVSYNNDPHITVLDEKLAPWLAFQPAAVSATDGPMKVEVPCRNLTEEVYEIEYRFLFFDRGNLEVRPSMSWQFVRLEPKETARLRGNAMSSQAVDYRLQVKWRN